MATIADLTAQLKLNNANFKKGLTGAQKALKGFQSQIGQLKGMIIGAFTVTAAIGTFKKAIASTQATGDKFAIAMSAADEATTSLLATIATGDFSGLLTNLRNAAKAGKEFAESMDEVSDRTRSVRIQTALAEKNIYKLRAIATDTSQSDEDRVKAYKEVLKLTSQQIKLERQITEDTLDAHIQKQVTRNNLTKEQGELLKDYITNYDQLTGNEFESVRHVQKLKEEWDRLDQALSGATIQQMGPQMIKGYARASDEAKVAYEQALSGLTSMERKYYDLGDAINRLTDEERDQIGNIIIQGAQLERKLQSLENEAVRGVGSIERKGKDATESMEALAQAVGEVDKSIYSHVTNVEKWMSSPFWESMDVSPGSGKNEAQDIADTLLEDFPEAEEEASNLAATVGYTLANSFGKLGDAIGKTMSGVDGAFKELGMALMDNLGNILMMAGISTGNWALAGIGAAMQIGSGIFGGLGDNVDAGNVGGSGMGAGAVNFRISGSDLVGVMDRQNYNNNMNT